MNKPLAICLFIAVHLSDAEPLTTYIPTGFNCPVIPPMPISDVYTEALKYIGAPYAKEGETILWREGKSFDCTTFITKVLLDAGFRLSSASITMINIAHLTKPEAVDAVMRRDAASAGVVWALESSHDGVAVKDTDQLMRGDIVQFWYKRSDGKIDGHAGIIVSRHSDGSFFVLGAHGNPTDGGSVGIQNYHLVPGQKNGSKTIIATYAVHPNPPSMPRPLDVAPN